MTALLTIAKKWRQPPWPSTEEQIECGDVYTTFGGVCFFKVEKWDKEAHEKVLDIIREMQTKAIMRYHCTPP
jgi:metal-dependent hydrolase (beta-lactamase superfamily II)